VLVGRGAEGEEVISLVLQLVLLVFPQVEVVVKMLLLATNHVEAVVVDLLEVGVEQQVLQATILLVLAVLVTSILEAMQQ
jgi:hypothetical protein